MSDKKIIIKLSKKKERDAEEKRKEERREEFMDWAIEFGTKLKRGEITHQKLMRMMRKLYPEFTPDDKEGEDASEIYGISDDDDEMDKFEGAEWEKNNPIDDEL
jgi:uncharacterized protein YdiU (UPF0061 family)